MSMRRFIEILSESAIESDAAASSTSMGKPLSGTFYNPKMMLEYFPSVQDEHAFNRAWRKIVRNQEETLLRNEMFEISRAFCDLLRMSDTDKLSFVRKLINIGGDAELEDETANTIYR